MKRPKHLATIAAVAAVIILALGVWAVTDSGGDEGDAEAHEAPALVEHIEGSELSRVTLTERAAERLDIQTGEVSEEQIDGAARRVIPYSAVLYDAEGKAWTYTNPEGLVFVRAPITVERIYESIAILTEGPDVGTRVVSVGGAMLYGAEFGVGH
jgi:hypothetical protein